MDHILDLRPLADDDTADVLHQALATVAWLQASTGVATPPSACTCSASLRDGIHTELLHATLAVHDHGYSTGQLAALLDLPG